MGKIHISTFDGLEAPLWSGDLPFNSKVNNALGWYSNEFIISSNSIHWICYVFAKNENGRIDSDIFNDVKKDLIAYNNSNGPFINPLTGQREIPDADGMVPEGTITRYSAIILFRENEIIMNNIMAQFMSDAIANGEMNV